MKITKIMKRVRKWAEKVQAQNPYSYGADLCGLCAVASKELARRLQKHGYKCQLACNDFHCFVLYKGRVLDVTATQFRKPEIYISRYLGGDWTPEAIFDSVEELTDYQYRVDWPEHQIFAEILN